MHIGAHKTGTTFLQACLALGKEKFKSESISIVNRQDMIDEEAIFENLWGYLKGDLTLPNAVENSKGQLYQEIVASGNNVLISNEDLFKNIRKFGDFYAKASKGIEFFQNLFEDYEIHVVFYIRNQIDYVSSIYTQFVHLGRSYSFNEFLKGELPKHLNWYKAVKKMEAVISKDLIHVETYESIIEVGESQFYERFLTLLGVVNTDQFTRDAEQVCNGRKANRSFSAVAIQIFRNAAPLLEKNDRLKLRRYLQNNLSTATHDRARFFSDERAARLRSYYSKSNEKLIKEWNIRCGIDSYNKQSSESA